MKRVSLAHSLKTTSGYNPLCPTASRSYSSAGYLAPMSRPTFFRSHDRLSANIPHPTFFMLRCAPPRMSTRLGAPLEASRPDPDSGFTLLEAMVASLIMAIAISALLVNLHTSLRNVERLSSNDRASVFAQHKMDELLSDPTLGVLAHVSGPYLPDAAADPLQLQSGWSARVRPFEYPPNLSSAVSLLEEIHLEVWFPRGGE